MPSMRDRCGRRIDYLRLSVTDRCNLRCVYCLPESGVNFRPSADLLSDDEIISLVECFAESGFSKVRITGGEPLVRPGLPGLIARIVKIRGIAEVSLTSNGVLLGGMASALAAAGLRRVNVSIDTLDAVNFKKITRFGDLAAVMNGLSAAVAAGLSPIKINVVIARGMNAGEIPDFIRLADARPLHVRFIELMPMGEAGFFSPERRVSLAEMMNAAGALLPVAAADSPAGNGPARYYRRPGALGTIGFISALSCGFCDSCNRVRMTASGTLVPCLDGAEGLDLRGPLRNGAPAAELRALIAKVLADKPSGHRMLERAALGRENSRYMCQIGG